MEQTTTTGQMIPDKLFYKAAEVCQITDTQPYVLRFWESEFPQLASEKNRSGQRVYRREDIDLVFRIKRLLYQEEYTIAGARKAIDEGRTTIVEPSPKPRVRHATPAEEPRQEPAAATAAPASLFGESRPEAPEPATPAPVIEESPYRALYEEALANIEAVKSELAQSEAHVSELRDRSLSLAARLEAALES